MVAARNIRIGVAQALVHGGPWGPASPPQALIAWFDPSDIATLFTDTAGTVPVTADGDLVACMKDKSGNNNHATQATSAARPIYRSGGYLDLDGARYLTTGSIQLTGSGQHSAGAAVYFNAVASYQNVLDADNGGSTRLSQFLRCNPSGQLETIAFNTTPAAFTDTGPSIAAATGVVLSEITTATTTEAFVNGVGSGGSTATSGSPAAVASVLTIGAFASGNSQFLTGKFCGSANYQGALSAGDHAQLVTFLTAKTIITINAFPSTGHLTFTGYQSAITLTTAVSPSTGHLIFGGKIPSVSVNFAVSPATGHLVFTGKTPTVALTTNVNPLTGHLVFGGHVPSVTLTTAVSPTTGHLTFGGKTPSVTLNVNVFPSTGHLVFVGHTPTLALGISPITGHLLFTGYAPDVTGTTVSSSALPLKVQFRHRNRNG